MSWSCAQRSRNASIPRPPPPIACTAERSNAMIRAPVCSRTTSRSLKTESLRTILPLHSIIARSFKFSTRMDNIESSDCLLVQGPCQGGGLYFQPDTTQRSFEAENIREVAGNEFLQKTLYLRDSNFPLQTQLQLA